MDETMAEFRVLSLSVSLNSIVEEQEVCSVQYARPLLHPSRANNNKRSRVWLKKKETEAILVIGVGGHSNRQSRGIYASWLVCLLCLSVCLSARHSPAPVSKLQDGSNLEIGSTTNKAELQRRTEA